MLNAVDIERLRAYEPTPESPVLSVYLDVDQSRAANLNREFVAALKTRVRAIERELPESERESFRRDAGRVERFVAGYQPHARTLVVFADDSAGLFWTGELRAPIATDVRWDA